MKKVLQVIKDVKPVKHIREHKHYSHLKKKARWLIEGVLAVAFVSASVGFVFGRLAYGTHGAVSPVVDMRKPVVGLVCTNGFRIVPTYYKKNERGIFERVSLVVVKNDATSTYELPTAVSGSGARFASFDEKIVFWEHQGEFSFSLNDKEVSMCHIEKMSHVKAIDTTVTINDLSVDMRGGTGVATYGSDGQFSITLKQFGEPVVGDFNGDGIQDAALLLSYEGGAGQFYYAVFALGNDQGDYIATNALLLGDTISPQTVFAKEGGVYYTFVTPPDKNEATSTATGEAQSIFITYDVKNKQITDSEKAYIPVYNPDEMTLSDRKWVWTYTAPMHGKKLTPYKPGIFSISFSKDMLVHIQTDCNLYTGTYAVDEDAIWFYDLVSAGSYCGDTQEDQFMTEIRQVTRFVFKSTGELVLTYEIGNSQMYFK